MFGSWRAPRPDGTRLLLVWDTKGALGMGDLTLRLGGPIRVEDGAFNFNGEPSWLDSEEV